MPEKHENQDTNTLINLIKKISHSDESAMADFYDLTVNRVYGMALKIVLRPELAEEVVGDVYMQVWKQANHFTSKRSPPIGWLMMICRSRALDKLRREKSATRNQFQETGSHASDSREDESLEIPLDEIIRNEVTTQLSIALKLLTTNQRQAIELAFYKGMSHQQISAYTGEPLGTVKSNIRRAQSVLRDALKKRNTSNEFSAGELYG